MKQNSFNVPKYIKTRAKDLPFHQCLILRNWQEAGLASIFISKKQPSGLFVFGVYMVDIFCLGLKNTFCSANVTQPEIDDLLEKFERQSGGYDLCDIVLAHNIIFGAIDYAAELGFSPQKDFAVSQYILNEDLIDDGIDEIEFGKYGQPYYFVGPYDNPARIIATLDKSVGSGNYHITYSDDLA